MRKYNLIEPKVGMKIRYTVGGGTIKYAAKITDTLNNTICLSLIGSSNKDFKIGYKYSTSKIGLIYLDNLKIKIKRRWITISPKV